MSSYTEFISLQLVPESSPNCRRVDLGEPSAALLLRCIPPENKIASLGLPTSEIRIKLEKLHQESSFSGKRTRRLVKGQ
jgi:hypothetical protein